MRWRASALLSGGASLFFDSMVGFLSVNHYALRIDLHSFPDLEPAVLAVHLHKEKFAPRLACLILDLAPVVPVFDAPLLDLVTGHVLIEINVAHNRHFCLIG